MKTIILYTEEEGKVNGWETLDEEGMTTGGGLAENKAEALQAATEKMKDQRSVWVVDYDCLCKTIAMLRPAENDLQRCRNVIAKFKQEEEEEEESNPYLLHGEESARAELFAMNR